MKKFLNAVLLLLVTGAFSQEKQMPDFTALDSLYREDQFYFGITYDVLQKLPKDMRQTKFSSGITLGFLRDMPVNKARTYAIAAGLGYSLNIYNHNLFITNTTGDYQYNIIDSDLAYDTNKLILQYIELPIEFRWRTSTPDSHKFWRVYTGFKFSYLISDKYKYKDSYTKFSSSSNEDLNEFQYGVYLATGYNTWNFNIYYGLNPIFKSAKVNGESVDMHTLNIGLMFYIL